MGFGVKTYDPAKVQVSVGGFTISGFAPGTFIELVPDVAIFRDDFGVDGEAIRWASQNPFHTLTMLLAQSSSSNFILSNFLNADMVTHAAVIPVLILDNNTEGSFKSTYVAHRSYIPAPPSIVFAGGAPSARRWTLRLLNLVHNTRGIDTTSNISI